MATQSKRETFQPEIPDQSDFNYLQFSRGVDVPRGFGNYFDGDDASAALFRGVSDLLGTTINAVDQAFQSQIRKEATDAVDQVRAEFGVDAVAETQAPAGQPTPGGLKRAYREIEGLTAAVQSGRLKESHYWGRLDSVARQLRHKYPGYREQIDQVISGLTGATPANAVRRALFAEAEAASSGMDAVERKMIELESKAAFEGYIEPDYEILKSQGKINRPEDIIRYVSPKAAIRHGVTDKKNIYALNEAEDKHSKSVRNSTYATDLHHFISSKLSVMKNGMTYEQVVDKVLEYARNVKEGNTGSAQDRADLIGSLQELELTTKLGIEKFRTERREGELKSWAEIFANDRDYEQIEEQHTNMIKVLREGLEKGDVALLKAAANYLEAGESQAAISMHQKYPMLKQINAVRKAVGDSMMPFIYQQDTKALGILKSIQLDGEVGENVLNRRPLKQSIRNMKSDGNATSEVVKSHVRRNIGVLLSPDVPDEIFENVVEAIYGTGNQAFLNEFHFEKSFLDPNTGVEHLFNDQHNMLTMLTQSQIRDKIFRISEEQGKPHLWENYKGWVMDSASALAFKDLGTWKELINTEQYKSGPKGIRFNPESMRFETFSKTPVLPKVNTFAYNTSQAQQSAGNTAEMLVSRLNKSMLPMINIFSKEGQNGVEQLQSILRGQGIELQVQR